MIADSKTDFKCLMKNLQFFCTKPYLRIILIIIENLLTNKINEYIINVNNIYIGGVSYMNEWWDGLSLLLKVLYCIAFPSTLILLVQTLLSMFGFHDGGSGHDFSDTSGLDLDVDTNISGHGDVDIGHCTHDIGCDHNVDGGNPADFASMRMFTLQTIVAFFTVFSWSSIVLVSSGVYPALSTVIGFVLGLATMLLVAKIVQLSVRLAENGTADYKNAIGETATVYIPCPPKDHGLGKVNVMINGQLREVTAINNGDELIKTGTQVRIIDLQGDTVVIEK